MMKKSFALLLAMTLLLTSLVCPVSGVAEEAKTYVFEAECTDMGHKTGLGYSGDATGREMIQGGPSNASGGAWVSYLYKQGLAVNFIIQSDRDVEDAQLVLRLACEFVNMSFNSKNYTVRVDYDLTEDDLEEYEGYWGEYFEEKPEGDVEITFSNINLEKSKTAEVNFLDFVVSESVSLHEGLNMISLVTNNDMALGLGTMAAIAPMVDCIKVVTDAQLSMVGAVDNGFGAEGCHIE